MEWKLRKRVWWGRRDRKRAKAGWLRCVGGILPPTGAQAQKDQVSAVYQQSIHGGSLAPLTITPQHLAIPTQETWGHFPPFREFRHTPAASHAPPQPIEEAARALWHAYSKLKRRSELWQRRIFTNTVLCYSGSVETKAEMVLISPFLVLHVRQMWCFFNQSEQLKAGLGCNV